MSEPAAQVIGDMGMFVGVFLFAALIFPASAAITCAVAWLDERRGTARPDTFYYVLLVVCLIGLFALVAWAMAPYRRY